MATVTREIASLDNGTVVVQLDFDDVTNSVSAVRVINNGSSAAQVSAHRSSDGLTYGRRFEPGTTTLPVPTSGPNRIAVTNIIGKTSGVSVSIQYPAL